MVIEFQLYKMKKFSWSVAQQCEYVNNTELYSLKLVKR